MVCVYTTIYISKVLERCAPVSSETAVCGKMSQVNFPKIKFLIKKKQLDWDYNIQAASMVQNY